MKYITIFTFSFVLIGFGGRVLSVFAKTASNDDDATITQLRVDSVRSKMHVLGKNMKKLRDDALSSLGDLKDSWRPGKKEVLLSRDSQRIIDYMKPVLEKYPRNLCTYGAYEQVALAYRSLGENNTANMWARRGINSIELLYKDYESKPESVVLLVIYRRLHSYLNNVSEEDYRHEMEFYASCEKNENYGDFKDIVLDTKARSLIEQGKYNDAIQILDLVDNFYNTQPPYERDRLEHSILRAQILYEQGKKGEAISVLKKFYHDTPWGRFKKAYVNRLIKEIETTGTQTTWPVLIKKSHE